MKSCVLNSLTSRRHEMQDVIDHESSALDAPGAVGRWFGDRATDEPRASFQRRRRRYVKVQPGRGHACRNARLSAERYAF